MSATFCAPGDLEGLSLFLDEQRAAIVRKLDGLSDADAVKVPTASALCPLTIVKHLAFCERRWFQLVVAGKQLPGLYPPDDPGEELRVDPGDTVASIRALYEEMCEQSRQAVAGSGGPDAPGHPADIGLNVRWVMLHMIEETARHAGHLDIIRESIDGVTGD
jgi:hypothetical protein